VVTSFASAKIAAAVGIESERWILKNELDKRFGVKIGNLLYVFMKNKLILRVLVSLYRMKAISVYG